MKITPLILGAASMVLVSPSATMAGTHNIEETKNYSELPTVYQEALKKVDDTQIKYTTTSVNMRKGADTDAEIVTTLDRNTMVDSVTEVGGWTLVLGEDNRYYFIYSEYLSDTETSASYSDDDLYVLAHIIDAEMGVESWEDKIITGSVVLNRVASSQFPNTIRKVVFQKGQYSPTWSGSFYREPSAESWKAARYLLENGSQIPSNVLYQAEFKQGSVWKRTKAAYYCYG